MRRTGVRLLGTLVLTAISAPVENCEERMMTGFVLFTFYLYTRKTQNDSG